MTYLEDLVLLLTDIKEQLRQLNSGTRTLSITKSAPAKIEQPEEIKEETKETKETEAAPEEDPEEEPKEEQKTDEIQR